MSEKLTHLIVMVRVLVEDRVRTGRERGATALEYVGMILVAAIVVGAVSAAITGAGIPGRLAAALAQILPG